MLLAAQLSWIPLVSLVVAAVTAVFILRIVASVLGQAMEHYNLAISARRLRMTHIARVKELELAMQREAGSRAAASAKRAELRNAPPTVPSEALVGVDIVPEALAA